MILSLHLFKCPFLASISYRVQVLSLLNSILFILLSLSVIIPRISGFYSQQFPQALMAGQLFLLVLFLTTSTAFTPEDNFLISCGSDSSSEIVYNRHFIGDSSDKGSSFLSEGKSSSLTNPNSAVIYSTARVFTSASSYTFNIKKLGTHLVRLHFSPFTSRDYNLKNGKFGVSANGISLLTTFSANVTVVKEFFVMVDRDELEIVFTPDDDSDFAFVSAIEVFSAPKDFFIDSVEIALISPQEISEFKQNISNQVLETVHRVNVGGLLLTPFNDTLWRTWIPDEDFLVIKSAAKVARTSDPPNYQQGGVTREVAPDNVYMTAQQMNVYNGSLVNHFNITWDFPVSSEGAMHLVRLHFCDIVSISLSMLYFNIYINGVTAYKDVDLSVLAFHRLASPYYIDFVVKNMRGSGVVRISVGPSDLSNTMKKNAILNGVEIMRMVNYVSPSPPKSKNGGKWIVLGCVVGGVLVLSLAVVTVVAILRCKIRKPKPKPKTRRAESTVWASLRIFGGGSSHGTISQGTALASPGPYGYYGLKIPFADLQIATDNFDKNLIVGSGGFGMVYKGVLKDDIKVAVKRGVPGSRQGLPEFQTEITVLSKIRHHHLVSLVGYCEEQSEMILVYEYMEKGPLRNHLYGSDSPPLSWKQRLEICIGAARGLHYLHTGSAQGIIHRDIKSTNILLDENCVAKVADFGLSKSGPCLDETHVSTGVKGSFGYLDPEYFRRQQLTDKSDVYSFGVVLFEVLCARPAVDPLLNREQVNLAEWAMEWHKKGMINEIIDPNLVGQIKPNSLKKFGETAEKCLAEYGVDRPTMGDVLWNLEYAYQLQTNERPREEEQRAADGDDEAHVVVPLRRADIDGDRDYDGGSDISTSRVFSQLLTNEGR
ncbi:probable receptor-like protein kinase At5g24010 [Salvia hispanica]|uniref:probable receptor-like protein kinase At5g24010 n=1 Tax=Salvia hispanica TaxID=49212 RepID=UPI002009673B|nr:probable receptor-like protein kinase At5g24010 [Salvia hispanica]